MRLRARRKHSGFTLVETLVALVVTSMLAGLLVSALFFATRTQVSVSRSFSEIFSQESARSRFEYVLAYCLPASTGAKPNFTAKADEIECFSAQSLADARLPAPMWVKLSLREAETGITKLLYWDESMPASATTEIGHFEGKVAFRFWGMSGPSVQRWPPNNERRLWLPRRIEIVGPTGGKDQVLWAVTGRVTPLPEPSQPSFFGVPL
jgi:prepilin-type N-terminal cleavage/methylation domain-containing protein